MAFEDISIIGLLVLVSVSLAQALGTGFLTKGYLPKKGELRALSEEQASLKDQLSQNTKIVEKIRDDLAQKSWAEQQLWETKKDAYDQIWRNMLDMKEYTTQRLSVDSKYYHIFLDYCGYSGVSDHCPDDIAQEYYEEAEREIAQQKSWFNKTYNTNRYLEEQSIKKETYILNMKKCLANIETQSLYLSPEASKITQFLQTLLSDSFNDNSYTWHVYERERISESEWYEHIIEEYQKLLSSIETEMEDLRILVEKELHLSDVHIVE